MSKLPGDVEGVETQFMLMPDGSLKSLRDSERIAALEKQLADEKELHRATRETAKAVMENKDATIAQLRETLKLLAGDVCRADNALWDEAVEACVAEIDQPRFDERGLAWDGDAQYAFGWARRELRGLRRGGP